MGPFFDEGIDNEGLDCYEPKPDGDHDPFPIPHQYPLFPFGMLFRYSGTRTDLIRYVSPEFLGISIKLRFDPSHAYF